MTRFAIVAAVLSLVLPGVSLWAQQNNGLRPTAPRTASLPASPSLPAPAAAGTQVALIDISYIFKNHPRYKQQRELLTQRAKALQDKAVEQRQYLTQQNDKLKDFQLGSLEYKRLEAELAQQASDFQVQNELKRKELMEEEVKLYYQTYEEVQAKVQTIADQYNIHLVIRFDREKMDPADADSVRRGILNNVVYQRQLDITDLVLAASTR